jgi:hypothetical protein
MFSIRKCGRIFLKKGGQLMAIIVTAKGLRYTMTLFDEYLKVLENADFKEKTINIIKKINFFNKSNDLLIDKIYQIKQIKNILYDNPTNDTSILELELLDGTNTKYEMTPADVKNSNALKTQVKQIADYIKERI